MEITGLILIFSKKNETKSFPFQVCREHDAQKTGQSRFNWNVWLHAIAYTLQTTRCARLMRLYLLEKLYYDVLYV